MAERWLDLNKHTTVAFALLKKFTDFVYDIEILKIRKELTQEFEKVEENEVTEKELKYYYIGTRLFNGLSRGRIRNLFNEKDARTPIEANRFEFFCKKFLQTFNDLNPEKREDYKDIKTAFIEWQKRISNKIEGEGDSQAANVELAEVGITTDIAYQLLLNSRPAAEISYYTDWYAHLLKDAKNETLNVILLVTDFFSSLNQREFKDAWNFLSFNGKNSHNWTSDYDNFKEHFSIKPIKQTAYVEIFEIIEISKNIYEVQVGYGFDTSVYSSELDNLYRMSIKDLNEFCESVTAFKDRLTALNATNIESVSLQALFRKDILQEVWEDRAPEGKKSMVNVFKSLKDFKLYNRHAWTVELFICKFFNGNWLIDNIRPIQQDEEVRMHIGTTRIHLY